MLDEIIFVTQLTRRCRFYSHLPRVFWNPGFILKSSSGSCSRLCGRLTGSILRGAAALLPVLTSHMLLVTKARQQQRGDGCSHRSLSTMNWAGSGFIGCLFSAVCLTARLFNPGRELSVKVVRCSCGAVFTPKLSVCPPNPSRLCWTAGTAAEWLRRNTRTCLQQLWWVSVCLSMLF